MCAKCASARLRLTHPSTRVVYPSRPPPLSFDRPPGGVLDQVDSFPAWPFKNYLQLKACKPLPFPFYVSIPFRFFIPPICFERRHGFLVPQNAIPGPRVADGEPGEASLRNVRTPTNAVTARWDNGESLEEANNDEILGKAAPATLKAHKAELEEDPKVNAALQPSKQLLCPQPAGFWAGNFRFLQ